jgi:hypothetical protein
LIITHSAWMPLSAPHLRTVSASSLFGLVREDQPAPEGELASPSPGRRRQRRPPRQQPRPPLPRSPAAEFSRSVPVMVVSPCCDAFPCAFAMMLALSRAAAQRAP